MPNRTLINELRLYRHSVKHPPIQNLIFKLNEAQKVFKRFILASHSERKAPIVKAIYSPFRIDVEA